jgi:hypothetical protein
MPLAQCRVESDSSQVAAAEGARQQRGVLHGRWCTSNICHVGPVHYQVQKAGGASLAISAMWDQKERKGKFNDKQRVATTGSRECETAESARQKRTRERLTQTMAMAMAIP